MVIFKTTAALTTYIEKQRSLGRSIGFVPTMGALHQGHIFLIHESKMQAGITICSIFVNPTQFNNTADFEKYPITIENDIDMLEKAGCDILFLPPVTEVYPPDLVKPHYELGHIETILEGKYRPGHFQGVCQVVDRLLSLVQPHALYLGQKDYQQCMVLKKLVELKGLSINIIICDTVREADGLAMSSRNLRLSPEERKQAVKIYRTLSFVKNEIKQGWLEDIKIRAVNDLTSNGFKVDYVEIADADNLEPQETWDGKRALVILIAAYLNEIRLIDNMLMN